jgi:hypothetical protein
MVISARIVNSFFLMAILLCFYVSVNLSYPSYRFDYKNMSIRIYKTDITRSDEHCKNKKSAPNWNAFDL